MPRVSYDGMGPDPKLNAGAKEAWSASGVMTTKNTSKTVSLQAVFRKPGTYTVSFSLNPLSDVIVKAAALRAEADIEWSVEGNTVTRRVSITNGLSVQGNGEGIRVIVRDVSVDLGPPSPNVDYAIVIDVVHGERGGFDTPPFLLVQPGAAFLAGAGANVVVPVPQDAGAKTMMVLVARNTADATPILDQDVKVIQSDASGITVATYDPRSVQWAPIGPGVATITVWNASANAIYATVIFGIDG